MEEGAPAALPPPPNAAASVRVLDRKVVQALFSSLRTSIPVDVRQALLGDSVEELKFLIARHPRLSGFHHRRRHSLRHPALAMATKNYYQLCRRKRLELAVQAATAELNGEWARPLDLQNYHDDLAMAVAAQREAELVDLLLAEYAESGGFQEEPNWLNHHSPLANFAESNRFSLSLSVGSRGAGASGQLMGSTTALDFRAEASMSLGDPRTSNGVFVTELGNTSMVGTSPGWRNGASVSFAAMSDSAAMGSSGRLPPTPSGNATTPNGFGESSSASPRGGKNARGHPGGAGRFFTKRHDRAGGGDGTRGAGGGSGEGGFHWGAEMHAMLVRRAEEELRAGTGGDPFLLTCSRPIELLLACYGGAQRDPAVMARGVAALTLGFDGAAAQAATAAGSSPTAAAGGSAAASTPADGDLLLSTVAEEDQRWARLGQCFRQMLRDAEEARAAAVAAVASDPLVNDVIRRFWDRLTVSAAAQQAHKAREASKRRDVAEAAAAARRSRSRTTAEVVDEDDQDELQPVDDDGAGPEPAGSSPSRRSGRSPSRVARDGPEGLARGGAKGGGVGRAKAGQKRKAGGVGFGAGRQAAAAEPSSTVASYMTPLQYVYLHTRMAHVLLPDSGAVDMELLYYIQEDLLVDAAYSEGDGEQPRYFGNAPPLAGSDSGTTGGGDRLRSAGKQRGLKDRFGEWGGGGDGGSGGGAAADDGDRSGAAAALQRRFLSVRRYGRNADNAGDASPHSPRSRNSPRGTEKGGGTVAAPKGLPMVGMCFNLSELPSLTYPQFWCSMMELADNWTCCAGHPAETAVFLWELYAEAFGHAWGAEDEALATALEAKAAAVSTEERTAMDAEVADALRTFHKLVRKLRAGDRDGRPLSSSAAAGRAKASLTDGLAFLPGGGTRRRRRGPQVGDGAAIVGLEDSATWELTSSPTASDLSVTEWNAMTGGDAGAPGEWVFVDRVGEDGVSRRYRRRIVHRQRRRKGRGRRERKTTKKNAKDGAAEASDSSDSSEEEVDSYLLEEELDTSGAVVRQRKRRCKSEPAGKQRRRRGRATAAGEDAEAADLTSAVLYERRHRYDEDRAKRLRRLEPNRRVEPGSSRASSMTSWTSIDDGATDDRRNGRRRRQRIRRTGPRRDRLLERVAAYTTDEEEEEETEEEDASVVDSALPPHTTPAAADAPDTDGAGSAVAAASASATALAAMNASSAAAASRPPLTAEELADLLASKEWLCGVLGAKGIHLPPHMFDDPAEQVLLYELLRLARESEARGGGAGAGDGAGGGDGLFSLTDGEGIGGLDLSRLAALLAQSAAFNLEGLDNSALMQRLLRDGAAAAAATLSPAQLQSLLQALGDGQRLGDQGEGGFGSETESMRNRRLRQLQLLQEAQAREREAAAAAAETEAVVTMAQEAPPVEATEATAADSAHPQAIAPQPTPTVSELVSVPAAATDVPPVAPPLHPSPPAGRVAGRVPPKPPAPPTLDATRDAERTATPINEAERREQERLFHELEAYWTERASQRGRYKVDIVSYTPEQLEEFFAHLHLGSRQRALLRGRAPLAAATSLVGGTLHQEVSRTGGQSSLGAGPRRAADESRLPPPLLPAPVKLFTLTTEASLDAALWESYQSYVSDRAFSTAARDEARAAPLPPPAASAEGRAKSQRLPPLAAAGALRAGGAAEQRRAAPPPHLSSTASSARRLPPSSSKAASSSLPRV